MDNLLREFLGDAEQLVDTLGDDLQALRAGSNDGRMRRELLSRIFRYMHTLKASSAVLELSSISDLAHEVENLLDSLRLGRSTLNERVLDVLDETVTVISSLLRAIAEGKQDAVSPLVKDRLRELAQSNNGQGNRSAAMVQVTSALPNEISGVLSEQEIHRLDESLSEGSKAYLVEANFPLETFDTSFKVLSDILSETGEIVSTHPGLSQDSEDNVSFRVVCSTNISSAQLNAKLSQFEKVQVRELSVATTDQSDASGVDDRSTQLSAGPLTTFLRIDALELNALIDASRDLFAETMQVLDDSISKAKGQAGLESRSEELRKKFEKLEKDLLRMQTVPVGRTFERAIRAGNVAAREVGKEIDFLSEGGDARIDKFVSDRIADSLLHILRNAVDHGIESSEQRISKGKKARGCIKLEAAIEDGRLRIQVTDDGRGIDVLALKQTAYEKGMMDADTEISDEEILRLIFKPGFSTAKSVSGLSGRGIGLDIVERAVNDAGGKILVRTKVDVGTTFEMLMTSS